MKRFLRWICLAALCCAALAGCGREAEKPRICAFLLTENGETVWTELLPGEGGAAAFDSHVAAGGVNRSITVFCAGEIEIEAEGEDCQLFFGTPRRARGGWLLDFERSVLTGRRAVGRGQCTVNLYPGASGEAALIVRAGGETARLTLTQGPDAPDEASARVRGTLRRID